MDGGSWCVLCIMEGETCHLFIEVKLGSRKEKMGHQVKKQNNLEISYVAYLPGND